MELRQLECFLAVNEHGSVTAAAHALRVSQPTLSQRIQALEEEFGEALLIRKPRGVEATPAGELLLEHARRILDEADRLKVRFDHRREIQEGLTVFGIIPTLAPYLLPAVLRPFRASFPRIDVQVREATTNRLIQQLVEGAIEFAILSDVTRRERTKWSLHVRELFREPLLLAAPGNHPFATAERPPCPGDLEADQLIHLREGHCLTERTLKVCRLRNPDSKLECDQLETALAMVAAGMGIAVVPQIAVRGRAIPNVVIRPFGQDAPDRTISLMKRRGSHLSPASLELVRLIERMAPNPT